MALTIKREHENVTEALERFLDGRELHGADAVRAAAARRLAEALEDAPPYAAPKIAVALESILAELAPAIEADQAQDVAGRALRAIR